MPIVFRTSNAEAHADMYAYKYPTLLAHADAPCKQADMP